MSTASLNFCLLGDNAVTAWYDDLIEKQILRPDARQAEAVRRLQNFADEITENDGVASGRWKERLRAVFAAPKPPPKRGWYLYGGVGRGKSFLMDGFFLQLPWERKLRVHFHQFMRHLHADMKALENESDPLLRVADKIADRYDLICFDEFHVSDITDAMLLGRLLEILLSRHVRFVMTSNYPPSGLYPNGLARDRFLPTIALLEARLNLFALSGEEDYRRRHFADSPAYFSPWNEETERRMRESFDKLACNMVLPKRVTLSGRTVPAVARTSDCVWFDFFTLCESARSKEDYLQLAERFATIFLSEVPRLDVPELSEAARRFTWLVDILYDRRIKFVLGAMPPLEALYGGGEGGESGRTLSRLREMQSAVFGSAANGGYIQ